MAVIQERRLRVGLIVFCTNHLLHIAGVPTSLTLLAWIMPVVLARLILIRRIQSALAMIFFWMASLWIMTFSILVDRWLYDAGYCGFRPLGVPAGPW